MIEAFNECLRNNEEGLVVKKYDMKYKPNVRDGGGCYKIKAEVKHINFCHYKSFKRNLIYDKVACLENKILKICVIHVMVFPSNFRKENVYQRIYNRHVIYYG